MGNYKSCGNCACDQCFAEMNGHCWDWSPIPCPNCGGILSDAREYNGRKYRHCYACHFEFVEEGTANEIQH